MKNIKKQKGFTLIEILVVIGIVAILAAAVLIAINPARQFAQARNSQRLSNVNSVLNAIGQRMADNKGLFRISTDIVCTAAMDIPTATSTIASSGGVDLRPCLVPAYMSELPIDPQTGVFTNGASYNTMYTVVAATSTAWRVVVTAPSAELGQSISITR